MERVRCASLAKRSERTELATSGCYVLTRLCVCGSVEAGPLGTSPVKRTFRHIRRRSIVCSILLLKCFRNCSLLIN
jgi:hypothetical protein